MCGVGWEGGSLGPELRVVLRTQHLKSSEFSVCVCVCALRWVCALHMDVHAYMHMYRGQRSALDVLLYLAPPYSYSLETGHLIKPRIAWQLALAIPLPLPLPTSKHRGYRFPCGQTQLLCGCWEFKKVLCTCVKCS